MRIILDIDGVLADFNNAYADLLEVMGAPAIDRTPPWPLKWEWPSEVAPQEVCDAAWEVVQQNPEFFVQISPTPEALQLSATGELAQLLASHEIYVVTSRPQFARGASEFWLGELFGEFMGTIHVPGPKGPIAHALGAQLLIDDKPEHCQSAIAHGLEAICIAQPYNEGTATLSQVVRSLIAPTPSELGGRSDG